MDVGSTVVPAIAAPLATALATDVIIKWMRHKKPEHTANMPASVKADITNAVAPFALATKMVAVPLVVNKVLKKEKNPYKQLSTTLGAAAGAELAEAIYNKVDTDPRTASFGAASKMAIAQTLGAIVGGYLVSQAHNKLEKKYPQKMPTGAGSSTTGMKAGFDSAGALAVAVAPNTTLTGGSLIGAGGAVAADVLDRSSGRQVSDEEKELREKYRRNALIAGGLALGALGIYNAVKAYKNWDNKDLAANVKMKSDLQKTMNLQKGFAIGAPIAGVLLASHLAKKKAIANHKYEKIIDESKKEGATPLGSAVHQSSGSSETGQTA